MTERAGRLAGRTAVVTGAARGIGRALAFGLISEGARVVCVDIDEQGVVATAGDLEQQAGEGWVAAFGCDLRQLNAVEAVLQQSIRWFGEGVDVLVANAGGPGGDTSPFLELSSETWKAMVERNLTSAFNSGLVFGRHMASRGSGAMVFVSSQLSTVVRSGLAHYSASKAAVSQLVRAMALELAPTGVRVNAIAPGPTNTEGTEDLFERPEVAEVLSRMIPLGRVADPTEMVGATVFLASDEASFVTGSIVFVDGGYTIV